MAYADGDDFVSGAILSYQQANRMKNHWRQAAAPANPSAGMIRSDSDDDTVWHCIAPGTWREIVQTTVPVLDDLPIVKGTDSDVSDRYDEAINDAWIFGVPVSPKRGIIYCRQADVGQNFTSLITASTEVRKHIIDADKDSVFVYGFYSDDVGLLTVPANPLRENLLTNSGFGVWSNSDANKGLGTMNYDGGSGTPMVVGETMTAASGALGKVIYYTITGGSFAGNNAAGVMYLGACDGRFNDNEAVTGGTGGGHVHVNQPDTGVGVDLVRNGEFLNDTDPPPGWAESNATLTTEAGGQVGNCMQVVLTNNQGDARPVAAITVTPGKIYKLSFYYKNTANDLGMFGVWDIINSIYLNPGGAKQLLPDSVAWVRYLWTFEAPDACTSIEIMLGGQVNTDIIFFDEVSLYEITPCCTAVDALAMDTWIKNDTTLDLYREHWGSNTKDGSFYACKLVITTAGHAINWPGGYNTKEEWLKQFAGRTVTFGAWVKTLTANHTRLRIFDGATNTYSAYHTGGGTYEWLEVTATMASALTYAYFLIHTYIAPNVNGSTIVYVSQPMLVWGSSCGIGNFIAKRGEWIHNEKAIPLSTLNNKTGLSDVAFADMNAEAESEGIIPKGAKALLIGANVNDSGSAGTDCYLVFRKDATLAEQLYFSSYGLANDAIHRGEGIINLDANGDLDYKIEASGVGTLDIEAARYMAVQVN